MIRIAVLLFLIFSTSSTSYSQQYNVSNTIPISSLPNATSIDFFGYGSINNLGHIAGGWNKSAASISFIRAFINDGTSTIDYSPMSSIISLGTNLITINEFDEVAGFVGSYPYFFSNTYAYSTSSFITNPTSLSNFSFFDPNYQNLVVTDSAENVSTLYVGRANKTGGAATLPATLPIAFYQGIGYDLAAFAATNVPNYNGTVLASADVINDTLEVVGKVLSPFVTTQYYRLNLGNLTFANLLPPPLVPAALSVVVSDINNIGDVIGSAVGSSSNTTPFYWDSNNVVNLLPMPAGYLYGNVVSISDSRIAVGEVWNNLLINGYLVKVPVIWDLNANTVTVLSSLNITGIPTGVVLGTPKDISKAGNKLLIGGRTAGANFDTYLIVVDL